MMDDTRITWVKRVAERLERRYPRYALAFAIASEANVELVLNERLHREADTPERRASKEADLIKRLDDFKGTAKIRAYIRRLDRAQQRLDRVEHDLSAKPKRKCRRKPRKRDL